jgi:tRNA U54 and U55 pseudouridine synthase Pus10
LLSNLNDDEQQTVISFRSREFRHDGLERSFDFERVQTLTRQEVADLCGKYFKKVQEFTDEAFHDVKKGKPLSPQQLGTKVHKQVEEKIKAFKIEDEISDEDLKAELSFAKETSGNDRRGAKDTVRLDVYNKVDDKTVCIDDIKTGRSELSYKRMKELVSAVSKKNSNIERIIVTEVRPAGMRPPKPRPPTLQED